MGGGVGDFAGGLGALDDLAGGGWEEVCYGPEGGLLQDGRCYGSPDGDWGWLEIYGMGMRSLDPSTNNISPLHRPSLWLLIVKTRSLPLVCILHHRLIGPLLNHIPLLGSVLPELPDRRRILHTAIEIAPEAPQKLWIGE
jgi:hypothetical protein